MRAQEAPPPAYLSVVTGAATLERDGEIEPAVVNMPIVEGDILRTTSGRIEVVFPDGSAIEIDPDSEVEFISATRVRVVRGAMEHRMADAQEPPAASAEYLPQDLRMYAGTLDRSGSWQYDASYGNVWYPSVTSDWRPYYNGSWSAVPSYGWTWIGADAWSWPTHHYGRWGYGRNAWFWIPGRTWSAAWVTWASATDYVGWCPLGFDGRPVFGLSTGYNRGWNGWTMLSRNHFGARGVYAPRYSVDPRRIVSNTPFIEHARAPVGPRTMGRRQPPVAGSQSSVSSPQSPVPGRQPSGGSIQAPVGSPHSSTSHRPGSVLSPGRATPRVTSDSRSGLSDPRPALGDARSPTSDQPHSIPGDRVPATGYRAQAPGYRTPSADDRTPSAGYGTPSPDYGRGPAIAVPRSEISRPGMPRAQVPIVIPPSPAPIVGGSDATVRSGERARPSTGHQAPPAAYRPPPAAAAAESRPPANGASAPQRAAPAGAPQSAAPASAPQRAVPRSSGESGRAGAAPAGARQPR